MEEPEEVIKKLKAEVPVTREEFLGAMEKVLECITDLQSFYLSDEVKELRKKWGMI